MVLTFWFISISLSLPSSSPHYGLLVRSREREEKTTNSVLIRCGFLMPWHTLIAPWHDLFLKRTKKTIFSTANTVSIWITVATYRVRDRFLVFFGEHRNGFGIWKLLPRNGWSTIGDCCCCCQAHILWLKSIESNLVAFNVNEFDSLPFHFFYLLLRKHLQWDLHIINFNEFPSSSSAAFDCSSFCAAKSQIKIRLQQIKKNRRETVVNFIVGPSKRQ